MKTENFIEIKRRMLEKGRTTLNYEISDPIKNTAFFWYPDYSLLQRQGFSDTAQMLGYFSKHPEYLGYVDTKPIDLHSALGLTTMRPMPGNPFDYGEDETELLKCQVLPGLQTSLIRAYRAKSETFPIRERDRKFIDHIRDNAALTLFQASSFLPYIQKNTDIGLYIAHFFPSLCDTPEKIRKYWEEVYEARGIRDEDKSEFVERWVDHTNLWRSEERAAIRTLENLAEESLNFVREFAPEEYKRFSRAVSK